jgi:hypothetical protein
LSHRVLYYYSGSGNNTDESQDRYKLVIQEWLTSHRKFPPNGPTATHCHTIPDITINEIFLPYLKHCQKYYRKNGKPTREVGNIKTDLKPLLKMYGTYPAKDFGPLALKTYLKLQIEEGFTRQVINKKLIRVKQFFKWSVANEMIPPHIYQALQAVPGLRRGRTAAPESKPVQPVPMERVEATIKHANRYVEALQRPPETQFCLR